MSLYYEKNNRQSTGDTLKVLASMSHQKKKTIAPTDYITMILMTAESVRQGRFHLRHLHLEMMPSAACRAACFLSASDIEFALPQLPLGCHLELLELSGRPERPRQQQREHETVVML